MQTPRSQLRLFTACAALIAVVVTEQQLHDMPILRRLTEIAAAAVATLFVAAALWSRTEGWIARRGVIAGGAVGLATSLLAVVAYWIITPFFGTLADFLGKRAMHGIAPEYLFVVPYFSLFSIFLVGPAVIPLGISLGAFCAWRLSASRPTEEAEIVSD